MSQITDKELLNLFQNPDTSKQGFNLIVRNFQERIYWHVRKIVINHDDANDVVQNTFIKAWKALPNFRGDSKLYTWLYRIATNESITFLKKKRKHLFQSIDEVSLGLSAKIEGSFFDGDEIEKKLQDAWEETSKIQPKDKVEKSWQDFSSRTFNRKKKPIKPWHYAAAAVLVTFLSIGGLRMYNNSSFESSIASNINIIENPGNQNKTVYLPDGSLVELEPNSQLEFSDNFKIHKDQNYFGTGGSLYGAKNILQKKFLRKHYYRKKNERNRFFT